MNTLSKTYLSKKGNQKINQKIQNARQTENLLHVIVQCRGTNYLQLQREFLILNQLII